jgi:predicted ABC-type ATPase
MDETLEQMVARLEREKQGTGAPPPPAGAGDPLLAAIRKAETAKLPSLPPAVVTQPETPPPPPGGYDFGQGRGLNPEYLAALMPSVAPAPQPSVHERALELAKSMVVPTPADSAVAAAQLKGQEGDLNYPAKLSADAMIGGPAYRFARGMYDPFRQLAYAAVNKMAGTQLRPTAGAPTQYGQPDIPFDQPTYVKPGQSLLAYQPAQNPAPTLGQSALQAAAIGLAGPVEGKLEAAIVAGGVRPALARAASSVITGYGVGRIFGPQDPNASGELGAVLGLATAFLRNTPGAPRRTQGPTEPPGGAPPGPGGPTEPPGGAPPTFGGPTEPPGPPGGPPAAPIDVVAAQGGEPPPPPPGGEPPTAWSQDIAPSSGILEPAQPEGIITPRQTAEMYYTMVGKLTDEAKKAFPDLARLDERATPYDTPAIRQARIDALGYGEPTSDIPASGKANAGELAKWMRHYDALPPEEQRLPQAFIDRQRAWLNTLREAKPKTRGDLRQLIVDDWYGQGAPVKDKQITFVIGGPGAGKSTISEGIANRMGAKIVDSDFFKTRLPEFDGGAAAQRVHKESTMIRDMALRKATASGDNLVLETVSPKVEDIKGWIAEAKEKGYTTHVAFADVPMDISIPRAIQRYHETGRFVDPAYIYHDVGHGPAASFEAARGHPDVASWEHYDNSIEGQPPRRTASSQEAVAGNGAGAGGVGDAADANRSSDLGQGEGAAGRGLANAAVQQSAEGAGHEVAPPTAPSLGPMSDQSGARGRTDAVFFGSHEYPATYRVVEASELQPSNSASTFAPNPNVPPEIQGRTYHGDAGRAAREQVAAQAAKLEPRRLIDAGRSGTEGPPTIRDDGLVVAGNQRTMMVQRAYAEHPEAATAYRQQLERDASIYGIDPEAVRDMREPVLVRELHPDAGDLHDVATLRRLNAESDVPATKAKDPASEGRTRAAAFEASGAIHKLNNDLRPDETVRGYLARDGKAFVQHLVEKGVIEPQELGRYLDTAAGKVTEEGATLIERMFDMSAVPDPNLVQRNPGVMRKIEHAVPTIVRLKTNPDWNIQPAVEEAIRLIDYTKTHNMTVADALAQGDLLGEITGDNWSPESAVLARAIEKENPTKLTKMFREFAASAGRSIGTAEEGPVDLFGAAERPAEAFDRIWPGAVRGGAEAALLHGAMDPISAGVAMLKEHGRKVKASMVTLADAWKSGFVQRYPELKGTKLLDRVVEWGAAKGYADMIHHEGVGTAREAAGRVKGAKFNYTQIEDAMMLRNFEGAAEARRVEAENAIQQIAPLRAEADQAAARLKILEPAILHTKMQEFLRVTKAPSSQVRVAEQLVAQLKKVVQDNARKIAQLKMQAKEAGKAEMHLHQHADALRGLVKTDVFKSPEMAAYLDVYRRMVEKPLEEMARTTGVAEEHLRQVAPDAAFVPLDAKFRQEPPHRDFVRVNPKMAGSKISSAAKAAKGFAQAYGRDVEQAVGRVVYERAAKAAETRALQSLVDMGQVVPKDHVPHESVSLLTFNDRGQLIEPTSPDVQRTIAVPKYAADAFRAATRATGIQPKPTAWGKVAKGSGAIARAVELGLSPAAAFAHIFRLAEAVRITNTGSPLRDVVLPWIPGANPIETAISLARVDRFKPEVQMELLKNAREGSSRPQYPAKSRLGAGLKWLGDKLVFNPGKMEQRAQVVISQRAAKSALRRTGKPLSPAERNIAVTTRIGNYPPANTPEAISALQESGATGFARFSVPFLRSHVKALFGSSATPREGMLGRMGAFSRQWGPPIAGVTALNYALSGHGPWANLPGHRTDVSLGRNKQTNEEDYLRTGYFFPGWDRAMRFTGLKAAVNQQGPRAMALGPVNVVGDMTSPLYRAAIGAAGYRPHFNPLTGDLQRSIPPQFSQGLELRRRALEGLTEGVGSVTSIFGTGYEEGKTAKERALDLVGLNPLTHGPSGLNTKELLNIIKLRGWEQARQAVVQQILLAPDSDHRKEIFKDVSDQLAGLVHDHEMTQIQRMQYEMEMRKLIMRQDFLQRAHIAAPSRKRSAAVMGAGAIPRR